MTFPVTQVKTRDAYGLTYASPSDPDFTIRFKTNVSNKVLGGSQIPNYLNEIIVNDMNSVTIGSGDVNDPVSVRVRTSGTLLSRTKIAEILTELADKLVTWEAENVFIGFEPTTLPGQVTP